MDEKRQEEPLPPQQLHKKEDVQQFFGHFDTMQRLYRRIYKRTKDKQLSWNVLHDTRRVVERYVDRGRSISYPKAFTMRVALRGLAKHYRRMARFQPLDAESVPARPSANIWGIEGIIDLREAMASLSPEDRRLVLGFFEGYTYRELAHKYGRGRRDISRVSYRLIKLIEYLLDYFGLPRDVARVLVIRMELKATKGKKRKKKLKKKPTPIQRMLDEIVACMERGVPFLEDVFRFRPIRLGPQNEVPRIGGPDQPEQSARLPDASVAEDVATGGRAEPTESDRAGGLT